MLHKDLGSQIKPAGPFAHHLVAGAASDNVEKKGAAIDRTGCMSAATRVPWRATLAAAATLTLTVKRYEADTEAGLSGASPTTVKAATVVKTGACTDATGVLEMDESLSPLKRFVQYSVTADLSAGSVDDADYGLITELGGSVDLPV